MTEAQKKKREEITKRKIKINTSTKVISQRSYKDWRESIYLF